jgi:hypothetical protein
VKDFGDSTLRDAYVVGLCVGVEKAKAAPVGAAFLELLGGL